jgi:hypothetical protein
MMSQTVFRDLFGELGRYFSAASRFVTEVVAGVKKVEAAQIPPETRKQAVDELRSLSKQFSSLTAANELLVDELTEYANGVRTSLDKVDTSG